MTIDWKLVITFWVLLCVVVVAYAAEPVAAVASRVDWTMIILAAITALPLTITQIINLIVAMRARQESKDDAAKNLEETRKNIEETQKTGKAVNGKMEEMKELISGKAAAEATVVEKEKQEARIVAVPVAPQVIVVQAPTATTPIPVLIENAAPVPVVEIKEKPK